MRIKYFLKNINKVKEYRLLKDNMLEKSESRLCIEFDYSQNRPLPV